MLKDLDNITPGLLKILNLIKVQLDRRRRDLKIISEALSLFLIEPKEQCRKIKMDLLFPKLGLYRIRIELGKVICS